MICRISPLAVIVGTIGSLGTGAQPLPAEYIVTNAAVYTVGSDRSWAQAIAVRDGRLVYVGTADGVERFQGPSTRVIDARGRMVLPGFHDAHIHPLAAALERDDCDVSQKTDLASLTAAISRCATTAPMKPWIVAFGWKEAQVSARIATSQALDQAVPDRPVVVKAAYEVGKRADFIVLDRNLFEIPSADIHSARVLWTVVGGQEVYCAENWDECPAGATRHDRQVQGAINELVKTSGWDRRCVRGGVDAIFDRLGTNAFQVGAPIRARRRPDTCIGREHTVHPGTEHHLSIQEDTDRERREEWRCGVPMGDPRAPGNTDRRPEPLLR
jgi:hypothetical protein